MKNRQLLPACCHKSAHTIMTTFEPVPVAAKSAIPCCLRGLPAV